MKSDLWRPWSLDEWSERPWRRILGRARRIKKETAPDAPGMREMLEAMKCQDWDHLRDLVRSHGK